MLVRFEPIKVDFRITTFGPAARVVKRCLDLVAGCALLVLLGPLIAAIALLIRLTSPGPIFFEQRRCGRAGHSFGMLKFRTMVIDGDRILANYLREHAEERLEWQRHHKLKSDPRITSMGKWLRRYSLDELPQLLNVIAGHMSLVGPRPIMEEEISKYGCRFNLYKQVPPGITGLWQVSGRNHATYEQRVGLDERYVRDWSVWLDLYILILTIRAVLTAEGAY